MNIKDKVFHWANENWKLLIENATYPKCYSVADQLMARFGIDYSMARDVANTISISRAVGLSK